MTLALHHSRAKGTDKVVLLGIANHDGDGGSWPSIDTLARYANVTRRAVQNSIKNLVDAGELVVHLQDGGTRRTDPRYRPNRYEIVLSCPPDCDGSSQHRVGVHGASSLRAGVQRGTARGEAQRVSGVQSASPEPSCEPEDLNRPQAADPSDRPDGVSNRDRGREAATGFWERVKTDTGHSPVGLRYMALAKLIEKFLDAGYPVPAVKQAVWTVYEAGRPMTLAVVEQYLDGRARGSARRGGAGGTERGLDALKAAIAAEEQHGARE